MREVFLRALIFSLNILVILFCQRATAKVVRYELNVTQSPVNITGKKEVDFSILVNGGIPAPTLEFTEGDDAEITVKNSIPTGEDVSIHWHGILLPPLEDGVPFVNTPPIYRGQSRTFKFKIRQNGTYWYHSHTMLQEQKGVYGAIVIHPRKETIKTDKEIVAVLSDWSDENADQILRNLKKDGDYYTFKKGTMRSYFGAIESGKLKNQFRNEWSRMGGMDLSDVGYDAFLINGKRDVQLLEAHPGEKIRIRIVNAASSTYFRVSLGGLPMKIISADGIDVEPISANEVLIGMAETYDILFQVPDHSNYELRATAQDGTGFSSGWIGMGKKILAPDVEKPDLYSVMEHSGMSTMDHSSMGKEESSKTKEVDHSNMNMDMNGKEQSLKHGSESKSKPNSSHTMETESEMDNMPGMNHSTKPAEEKKDSHETLLLPFKNVGYEFAGIGALVSSKEGLTQAQIEQIVLGYWDLFNVASGKKTEIDEALPVQDFSKIPMRVIVRNTSEYRNLLNDPPTNTLPSEVEQMNRGDIPFYFKFIADKRLYWLKGQEFLQAEESVGIFQRDSVNYLMLLW